MAFARCGSSRTWSDEPIGGFPGTSSRASEPCDRCKTSALIDGVFAVSEESPRESLLPIHLIRPREAKKDMHETYGLFFFGQIMRLEPYHAKPGKFRPSTALLAISRFQ